jgi:hypothetical protein
LSHCVCASSISCTKLFAAILVQPSHRLQPAEHCHVEDCITHSVGQQYLETHTESHLTSLSPFSFNHRRLSSFATSSCLASGSKPAFTTHTERRKIAAGFLKTYISPPPHYQPNCSKKQNGNDEECAKVTPCLIKHHTVNTHRGVEIQVHCWQLNCKEFWE